VDIFSRISEYTVDPDEAGADRQGDGKPTAARAPRLPRNEGLFAPVPLEELTDRSWDWMFPARVRLYLYLRIKSRRGAQTVRFTNEMAAAIGLPKQNKMRELRLLEKRGLVACARHGNRTPIVSVLMSPLIRNDVDLRPE
jgi:hypothetical protein